MDLKRPGRWCNPELLRRPGWKHWINLSKPSLPAVRLSKVRDGEEEAKARALIGECTDSWYFKALDGERRGRKG